MHNAVFQNRPGFTPPCSIICWFCSILCSTAFEFLLFLDFRVFCLLDGFPFNVALEANDWSEWVNEFITGPYCARPVGPEGKLKRWFITWSSQQREYTRVEVGLLHYEFCFALDVVQLLFRFTSDARTWSCYSLSCFSYLINSCLVLLQLSCTLMPIKTNVTKSASFVSNFYTAWKKIAQSIMGSTCGGRRAHDCHTIRRCLKANWTCNCSKLFPVFFFSPHTCSVNRMTGVISKLSSIKC